MRSKFMAELVAASFMVSSALGDEVTVRQFDLSNAQLRHISSRITDSEKFGVIPDCFTYDLTHLVGTDALGFFLIFDPSLPGATDDVVKFDGIPESIRTDVLGTVPTITETDVAGGGNMHTITISASSPIGTDLFPGGFTSGGLPLTSGAINLGIIVPDRVDTNPGTIVNLASLEFFTNGVSVAGPFDIANILSNANGAWDGTMAVTIGGLAGFGADQWTLIVQVTDNIGPSGDCNGNGIPDSCDIDSGISFDLNNNGVPDECDPDCNVNGIPDFIDIAFGNSLDCDLNGIPDECEVDCNGNGIVDDCDISTGFSVDIDGNGVPDECEPDCNGNLIPDSFDIATGTSNDFNSNGIPDKCEPDCNNNGLPDFLDIQFGTSQDSNQNGVPDECELDCNANGIWDNIDIEAGTSIDINGNLIPDECESDCNGNGVPDDWDIAIGTSVDFNNDGIPDECKPDCNGNGIPDFLDILFGASQDQNLNGIPDECECPGDITPAGGNGVVNIDDLVAVLNAFGACAAPPVSCGADITPLGGNGVVNIDDLVAVLNAFGACP